MYNFDIDRYLRPHTHTQITCRGIRQPIDVKHHVSKHSRKCQSHPEWNHNTQNATNNPKSSHQTNVKESRCIQQDTTDCWAEWETSGRTPVDWDSLARNRTHNRQRVNIVGANALPGRHWPHLRTKFCVIWPITNIKGSRTDRLENICVSLVKRFARMADFVTESALSMIHCRNPCSICSRTPTVTKEQTFKTMKRKVIWTFERVTSQNLYSDAMPNHTCRQRTDGRNRDLPRSNNPSHHHLKSTYQLLVFNINLSLK